MQSPQKKPSLLISSCPVIVLILLMFLNFLLEDNAIPTLYILVISSFFAGGISLLHLKIPYNEIELGMRKAIDSAMPAILIIFIVGSLIAAWIMSGIVPMFIYYGLQLINPSYFLFVACLLCCIISLAIGSSWSTAGTIGIALMGIGESLNIPLGMTAGAVISGAYFGDKMSPMSDTTNLAPAMVSTDVITHIKHMIYSSGPAIIISLIIYLLLGFYYTNGIIDNSALEEVRKTITEHFNITPLLLFVPFVVLYLVIKGISSMPALITGLLLAVIAIPIFQWQLLVNILGGEVTWMSAYSLIFSTLSNGFSIETGNSMIDRLFSRGGMISMTQVNLLAIVAMVFGGIMEVSGMLTRLTNTILKSVNSVGSLVSATIATCIFTNITAANQTMAIVLPARMFIDSYKSFKLHPKNLSRCIEDGGTVTAPLVPWNTNAVYMAGVLGISTGEYLFFAFFCLLSPIISVILGFTNLTMTKLPLNENLKVEKEQNIEKESLKKQKNILTY
ncbi:Na+/H+ antiporter NhaC [Colwellia sp. PAMC 21821]|uniref:Na+/H+ antiporter NhaC n=1 Tax=Colwellia sp. PAMC 21821 TaxID=1816219 RepID=UPI0009C04E57|nr:Na+/H+ antiporter NhaC [Colwellia sp. PAMC 21821]ARD43542.1 sodium:proton antiporter [Colwellia sp. PAMC 21821]